MLLAAIIVAAAYLAQLAAKVILALRYRTDCHNASAQIHTRDQSPPPAPAVSILQPILSGDPALEATLRANLETQHTAHFFWLINDTDVEATRICKKLAAENSARVITILRTPPSPQGVNPKVFKLAPALDQITTPYFVVLDDDTRLSAAGLRALIHGLDSGASLATGLPRYHSTGGCWSTCLVEFVNSSAVLTYLPPLTFSDPVSIHGMCYAMRTDEARSLDAFRSIERHLTDDLALAQLLQRHKLRIHQTIEPHDIATTLPTLRAFLRIMHRWFVFTRLLLAEQTLTARLAIAFACGLPPLLLWAAAALACLSPWYALLFAATLLARELTLRFTAIKFLGAETTRERSALASIAQELAQPFILVAAYCNKTILWRNQRIRVRKVDDFEYL